MNRDTKNSLNQLQEIFDRTEVQEKQELVGMLEKYGNQMIHNYAESKGWQDGSVEKTLIHGAFGALMGDMAGGNAMTGALAGGVNEYVIGYLTKEKGEDWVQQHPDTVQWISVGVGAAVGSLVGGNGLDAAGIALSGTKWNYYGSRKDKNGKISGMGKIAALLQPDGTYQYVENVNGTDINRSRDELYQYTSVWIEDPENPGMGYTYIINGDKGDVYYSGTFDEERFDNENKSMIYSGVSNWKEMESIIPGFHHTDKVGDETFPGISWADNLECLAPTRSQVLVSLGENTAAEVLNAPWNSAVESLPGSVKTGVKWGLRFGGTAGITFTAIDVIQDYNKYSGWRLGQVLLYDALPVIGGAVGGGVFGAPGAIGGSTMGDYAKIWLKNQVLTDKQIEANGQGKGADVK